MAVAIGLTRNVPLEKVSPTGRVTLVECKLWRNPEARRKVVAQTLDYARAVSRWSYSDLQRQVAVATGQSGNVPFERARAAVPGLEERRFVDETSRALRQGRFLLVIAGDGIREDVGGITELINRNAALGFAFGLVEVALYGLDDGGLLVQPRVVARTQIIERTVVVVRDGTQTAVVDDEADGLARCGGRQHPRATLQRRQNHKTLFRTRTTTLKVQKIAVRSKAHPSAL